MNKKVTTSYRYVAISDLSIESYQRGIDSTRIKKMARSFDETLLGTITVSLRDEKLNVVDGQHRVMLCKTIGKHGLMANVIEGLTLEEEAEYFNAFNGARGENKRLTQHDIFTAKVVAKEQGALEIKESVEKNGLKFGKGQANNTVAAYNTITKIHERYGKKHLERTLRLIVECWGGEKLSLHNMMVNGVSEFINIYEKEKNFNENTFVKQLSKIDPKRAVRDMMYDTTTTVTKVKAMNALFKYYNNGLRKKIENNLHFSMR